MKAAVLRSLDRPMAIEDVLIAKPGPREVLVRVVASGLCHSDLHILEGDMAHPLPAILGHEPAGIVEQVGADVRTVKPGDHVVVCLAFNCGHCEQCHGGHAWRCREPDTLRGPGEAPRVSQGGGAIEPFMAIGAFAEMVLVHESGCVAIDRDMPLDRACLIGCGVTTGFGAATRTANVRAGDSVMVIGCGGVGLAAVNGAYVAGAGRIIAVDRLPSKLALARRLGATDTIDPAAGDVVEQVMALTGGRGVDHAIEAIGRKDTIEAAFNGIAKGGVATIVGVARPDVKIELPALAFMREKRIQGSMMGGVRLAIDIPHYVGLYMQGRLKLDEFVSQRLTLAQVDKGFDDMRRGEIARSVITFDA